MSQFSQKIFGIMLDKVTAIATIAFFGVLNNIASATAATPVSNVPGVSLTGTDKQIITNYTGTIGNIVLDLGSLGLPSGTLNTGTVTLSLNPNLESSFTLDYDAGTGTGIYNLLGTSPALSSIGLLAVNITLSESGTIEEVLKINDAPSSIFSAFNTIDGEFTQTGQSGQTYSGSGIALLSSSYPYAFGVSIDNLTSGDLEVSFGSPAISIGQGTIVANEIIIEAVPEPLTIMGASSAIVFGTFFKRKIQGKK